MNDKVMRMAIECQLITTSNRTGIYADALQKFADLIRADEREACAKVCENDAWRCKKIAVETQDKKANAAALEAYLCAEAIRARGNT